MISECDRMKQGKGEKVVRTKLAGAYLVHSDQANNARIYIDVQSCQETMTGANVADVETGFNSSLEHSLWPIFHTKPIIVDEAAGLLQ